jgi:hypothetical protein
MLSSKPIRNETKKVENKNESTRICSLPVESPTLFRGEKLNVDRIRDKTTIFGKYSEAKVGAEHSQRAGFGRLNCRLIKLHLENHTASRAASK